MGTGRGQAKGRRRSVEPVPAQPLPRPPGPLGSPALVAGGFYAVAFLLNAAFALEMRGDPFFAEQLSDAAFYLQRASQMARGEGFGAEPFYVTPFYLFFLVTLKALSLDSVAAIRWAQISLVSGAAPLTYLAGRRLFSPPAGVWGGVLLLGYGPLAHAASEIAPAGLETLMVAGLLLLLSLPCGIAQCAAAGLLAGLLTLSRPTFLLFAVAAAVAVAVAGQGRPARSRALLRGLTLLGCLALVLAPVAARNRVVGGDAVLVASHGGINFYIGNSPGADGRFYAPAGMQENLTSINSQDSKAVAEAALGRRLKPSESSGYWFGEGLRYLAGHPLDALRLYLRKTFLFLHSYEVPLNSDHLLLRSRSVVLSLLRVPFAFLWPLGLLGLLRFGKPGGRVLFPLLLIGSHAATVIAFFVSSRYRLPLLPALAVGGGVTLSVLARAENRDRRSLTLVFAGVVLAVLFSLPYPLIRDMQGDSWSSQHESLGIRRFDSGDFAGSERELREAIRIRPANKAPHWYLARILEARGDLVLAASEWELAARLYAPGSFWAQEAARNAARLKARRVRRP